MSNTIQILGPRGNTLAVHAAGEGPTLFLLHGFPLDHRMWQNQLSDLCSRLHVVAVHFRGFGCASLDEPQYSLADLAQDVEFLRQHLAANEKIWLAGLSMGGYVAFEYWRQCANHLHGLILSNTKPTGDNNEAKLNRRAMADKALKSGSWAAVEPMYYKLLAEQTVASKPDVAALVKTMMVTPDPNSVAAAQNAMAERRDFTEQLSAIQCPTLVIAGESDPIAPAEDGRKWASQIPNSRFEVIPTSRHLSPLENPAAFNQLVLSFVRA